MVEIACKNCGLILKYMGNLIKWDFLYKCPSCQCIVVDDIKLIITAQYRPMFKLKGGA